MQMSARRGIVRYTALKLLGGSLILALSYYMGIQVLHPGSIRTLLGYSIILFTIAISIKKPTSAITLMLVYLPLLGLIRRILIPIAGWGSFDPLVLVGPIFALLVGSYWFYNRLFRRVDIQHDTPFFRLVRILLIVNLLEVVNPRQGSIMVGIGGMIYYVVPLFWMVIGRTVLTNKYMKKLMLVTFVMCILAAAYGLKQTYYGFYPFEEQWISIVRITALHVGNQYRALSTPDNPQEYAEFLAMGMVIGWVYIICGNKFGKIFALFGTGLMGWAIFMESARGPLILAAVAIAVVTVLCAATARAKLITGLVVACILTGCIIFITHMHSSSNALVEHQIAGITGQNSSVSGHTSTMFSGIWRGAKSVIGYGLGSTTTAAGKFSSTNAGTEVDISNMFVSDGLIGGILYLVMMARYVIVALRYSMERSTISLFAVGILVATFEQWINGELYAVTTVLWLTIGYVDRIWAETDSRIHTPVSKQIKIGLRHSVQ